MGLGSSFEQVEAEMEKYKPERDLPEGTYADSLRQLLRFRIVDTQKRCITITSRLGMNLVSRGQTLPGRKGLVQCLTWICIAQSAHRQSTKYLPTAV